MAIIERYRRRESSVEEVLIETYLACVLVRRVEERRSGGMRVFAVSRRSSRGQATPHRWYRVVRDFVGAFDFHCPDLPEPDENDALGWPRQSDLCGRLSIM